MPSRSFNLAIETSGRLGSVTLGREDEILATVELPPQERHRLDLMPAIDRLCSDHGAKPADVGEIYLSIGPGSFTGLRIGVTTAKMFAQVTGCRIIAVPTLEVLARGIARGGPVAQWPSGQVEDSPERVTKGLVPIQQSAISNQQSEISPHLAVCLNLKRDTVYAGVFSWEGEQWELNTEPSVMTMRELLAHTPRPLMILGDPLPALGETLDSRLWTMDPTLAVARSVHVWALGREKASRGEYTDAMSLLPLYVREPEAVELWNKKHPGT